MTLTQIEVDALMGEIRSLLERYVGDRVPPLAGPGNPAVPDAYTVVDRKELVDGFEHRWPNRTVATSYRATDRVPTMRYAVRTAQGDYSLLVGAEEGGRTSYNKPGRGRVVVFVRRGPANALYPLVEFAETDELAQDGSALYAAGILKLDAPRSLSTARDLPALFERAPHLRDADIRPARELYRGMQTGPSLRLVVAVDDIGTMLAHALWVGGIRGGGRLPHPA